MTVAHGVCVGSWDKVARYVTPRLGVDTVLHGFSGRHSIANVYNRILDICAEDSDVDMLILQHDDLEITDPDAVTKFRATFAQSNVVLAGVAGGGVGNGIAWWTDNPIGRVQADPMLVNFGTHSGPVSMLDGCLLVFSRWAIEELRFWARSGFHGYDADICAKAIMAGRSVRAVDVVVHHHTTLGFDTVASYDDWLDADREFRETGYQHA